MEKITRGDKLTGLVAAVGILGALAMGASPKVKDNLSAILGDNTPQCIVVPPGSQTHALLERVTVGVSKNVKATLIVVSPEVVVIDHEGDQNLENACSKGLIELQKDSPLDRGLAGMQLYGKQKDLLGAPEILNQIHNHQ